MPFERTVSYMEVRNNPIGFGIIGNCEKFKYLDLGGEPLEVASCECTHPSQPLRHCTEFHHMRCHLTKCLKHS